jgi:outer membrane protein TolC
MKFFLVSMLFSLIVYGSSLDELIETALNNNISIKQLKLDIELSENKRKANSKARLGEVDVMASYNHYNTSRTLIPLTPIVIQSGQHVTTTKDVFSIGASYNVALFTGFAQTRQVEIDDLSKTLSGIKSKLTKEQIIYNIRALYLTILAQQELLKSQKKYTKALYDLKEMLKYEVKLGKKANIDLLKAKTDLASSKANESALIAQIEKTKASLSELVGKDIEMIEPLDIKMEYLNENTNDLILSSDKLQKIKVEELNIKKSAKMVSKVKSQNYPQVMFSSYYGKNYGEDETFNEWQNETLWQIGLNAKWNVFDFGKTTASIEQAKIVQMKASLKKEQTKLEIKKLLKQAVSELNLNYAQYEANKVQLELAKESTKIEKARYESDASTINDLLLAKAKEKMIVSKMIQSKYNYQKSKYYLDYLLERGEKSE